MKHKPIAHVFMTPIKPIAVIIGAIAIIMAAVLSTPTAARANTPGPITTLNVSASPTTIRHVEASGLNGYKPGKPRVRPWQVHHDMLRYAKNTDLITTTEVDTAARAHALKMRGWNVVWKGGQTAVVYRAAKFSLVWSGSKRVSNVKYYEFMAHRWLVPGNVTAVLLRVKATGQTVLVTVTHTVSCAFSRTDKGWIPSNQSCASGRKVGNKTFIHENASRVPSYKALMNGWVDWTKTLVARFHPDLTDVTGDFNLDFKRYWARHYLRTVWSRVGTPQLSWKHWAWKDYTHIMQSVHGTFHVNLDGDIIFGKGVSYQHSSVTMHEGVASDHSATEDVISMPAA